MLRLLVVVVLCSLACSQNDDEDFGVPVTGNPGNPSEGIFGQNETVLNSTTSTSTSTSTTIVTTTSSSSQFVDSDVTTTVSPFEPRFSLSFFPAALCIFMAFVVVVTIACCLFDIFKSKK